MDIVERTMAAELLVAWGVPHRDVPLYMNAADAMVFTSVQEGSPNVVKEALACDLPVVSVPVGDVPERIAGIEGCELCPDERPETIAAALVRVLRRQARIEGRVTVESLDERLLTARVIELYRTVLRRSSREAVRAGHRPAVSRA
jgi:glycosyltransferase involved in cell wall biosynthesis